MDILISVVLPLALAFIMLSLGLGLTVEDFHRVLTRPKAFAAGLLAQVVLVPLVAYLLLKIFALPPELAVGVMILSFCPGGVTSNIMSKLARGDVALSVSLTGVVSLLSMVTVPLLVAWAVSSLMGENAPPVDVTSLAISMALITTIPVLIGVLLRHFASGLIERVEPVVSKMAVVLFVVIVVAALAGNWGLFIEQIMVLGPVLVVMNVSLIVLGLALATLFGLDARERATIAVEAGVQNSTVGITLGAIVAGSAATGFSAFSLPSAVYGITMYAVTIPTVLRLRKRMAK